MIAQLRGQLAKKSPNLAVVDVNGVGYAVNIPLSTFYKLPNLEGPVALHIHTHMTENALRLFGFFTEDELKIFEVLISINKVGPKLALAILSGISVPELAAAVAGNDVVRLSAIPGVGQKTAERLALEIKGKLDGLLEGVGSEKSPANGGPLEGALGDALSALANLGYKKAEAEKILKRVRQENPGEISLEQLIKESLKHFS